jgi:Fe-S-cluster containining protein
MDFDFAPYFSKYEELVGTTEEAFNRIRGDHADCVKCKRGCAACCHALFDLTLIEALYINHKFNETFKGAKKETLLDFANRADRKTHKIKKKAYSLLKEGCKDEDILERVAAETVRCALLNGKDLCELYDYRPITCRLYGVPTAIGGKGHTCGLSGFSEGEAYPTVNQDRIQTSLVALSKALVADLKSKYATMGELLVPLSMALLTEYSAEYLGLGDKTEVRPGEEGGENE